MLRQSTKSIRVNNSYSILRTNSILYKNFSSSSLNYQATILKGKDIANSIKSNISSKILSKQQIFPDFQPKLSIIQIGNRPDSSAYVRMKLNASKNSNINCQIIKLEESTNELNLLNIINDLNLDPSVNGILIQLPLPPHLDEVKITNSVLPIKDVDGFHRFNIGELSKKNGSPYFLPCTPNGCIKLLKETGIPLEGKNAVVIGRSDIVGSPVATMLKNENCTVTICHSKTSNIDKIIKNADIIIAAIGKPNFVKGDWIKKDAIVIDVGINYLPDSTKKSGSKLVGDVDFQSVKENAKFLTPVPGGVGPMTVAMLIENVYKAALNQFKHLNKPLNIKPLKLDLLDPVPSDIQISRNQTPKLINEVANELGINYKDFENFGHYKGKVSLNVYENLKNKRNNGNYVLVAGITPTPLGEGKSTTTMGLVQALGAHLNIPAIANVRQPSMGPTFGVKGGAAGGGYAQVIPMDEFNLHLTGDIHSISIANNLLAAAIDTRIFHEKTQKDDAFYKRLVPKKNGIRKFTISMLKRLEKLGINKTNPDDLTIEEIKKFAKLNINPDSITIKRVVDVNDRFLRGITIGQAPTEKGITRQTGFDITVASEIMAILALSKDLKDLRERVGKIVIGSNMDGEPITCEDISCAGAITALLKDTIKPNLMQTLEGTPVFVHAGPFANISIGASSVIADKLALKLVGTPKESINDDSFEKGFVVTEAGFDFTMGGERFYNIKCRSSGLKPNVVVLVATTRALKLHGGAPDVKPGQILPDEYITENIQLVKNGASSNLRKQIENAISYGAPVVVAINKFATDTDNEISTIREEALKAGAFDAVESDHWSKGGLGAINLAKAVVRATKEKPLDEDKPANFLYDLNGSLEDRLRIIATKMYGAKDIELSELAKKQILEYESQGFGKLPVCIAKTQYSLSHDAKLKGVPTGFIFPIREVRISAGAGYLYALADKIMTIPGLSTHAGFMNVEVNDDGEIEGLF
ncbi:trifunctional formate-tetrahydrofolate ligase/methenyltetrahydrofolate cyclohydrolase/methylenetetrahydrofolate dehydrogenase [Pichia kluyveri]|uniref:Trifunctional formate-tetrahydrofolate ligase/methenyltetrahydrofolate cyclohydrolase/methylenetetrahydrofolate dehydrogenase n=1 Tax=Pichia kluyveri TaxID=36015 RepID=A0AAV5R2C9_PICKL|nr:trifunctional formate-tetrahydrofolate ligase/methenyltetrahydrofolate cyclohydrolase/methylenetetrahydrofolate dehydrogenase [Pichia kluyveri]